MSENFLYIVFTIFKLLADIRKPFNIFPVFPESVIANNNRITDNFATTNDLFTALVQQSKDFFEFVQQQDSTFFETPMAYQTWDGNPWEMAPKLMVHHCMNHSTYHRGQITTLGRQADFGEIKSTDFISYVTK